MPTQREISGAKSTAGTATAAQLSLPRGFDPEMGWESLVGYHAFSATMRSLAATGWLASAGLRVRSVGPGFLTVIRGIRFNRYSIAHVRTQSPIDVIWERRRPTATRRTALLFIEIGTLTVSTKAVNVTAHDFGGLGIVLPGAEDVGFELAPAMDFIWFTFDSLDVPAIPERAVLKADVAADSTLFRAAHAYLKVLAHTSEESSAVSAPILRELTRDFAQALSHEMFQPEQGTVAEAAQAMLEHRATDPLFTVSTMADELGISRRTLERECAKAGWAPADELRKSRARIAFDAMMSSPAPLHRIARASGFGSVDALNRAIRRMYGDVPSAFRSSATGS